MFQRLAAEKIKIHILRSITFFFRKSYRLWDNVEKLRGDGEATDEKIIWRMRFVCWITKTTDKHKQTNTHTHTQNM